LLFVPSVVQKWYFFIHYGIQIYYKSNPFKSWKFKKFLLKLIENYCNSTKMPIKQQKQWKILCSSSTRHVMICADQMLIWWFIQNGPSCLQHVLLTEYIKITTSMQSACYLKIETWIQDMSTRVFINSIGIITRTISEWPRQVKCVEFFT